MNSLPADRITMVDAAVPGPHGPVPVRRYSPAIAASGIEAPTIVWLHGGAFVSGGLDQRETHEVAKSLASHGFPIVTVDYRRATRAIFRRWGSAAIRFPIPLDDVMAVLGEVQRAAPGNAVPGGVILGGASAGACIAASAVFRLRAEAADTLAGVFFAYGLFHAIPPEPSPELSRRVHGLKRYFHSPRLLPLVNLNYAGSRAALADPFAFAGGHPLGDFPRTLMLDADNDWMRASGSQFATELEAAGVDLEYHVLAGSSHAFLNRPNDPRFAEGIRLIVEWAGATRPRR